MATPRTTTFKHPTLVIDHIYPAMQNPTSMTGFVLLHRRHTSAVCVGGVLTLVKLPNPQKSAKDEGTCKVIRDEPQHKLHSIIIKANGLRVYLTIDVHALG